MTDIQPSKPEPKRSKEYSNLLEELKQAFVSAANVAAKLYEQGKKDGLSNEEIRRDIEITLDGIVKERRLREILPLELKRPYALKTKAEIYEEIAASDSAMNAEWEEEEKERALAKELAMIIVQVRKEQAGKTFDSNYDRVSAEALGVHDRHTLCLHIFHRCVKHYTANCLD
jgi:hypothetical protein